MITKKAPSKYERCLLVLIVMNIPQSENILGNREMRFQKVKPFMQIFEAMNRILVLI